MYRSHVTAFALSLLFGSIGCNAPMGDETELDEVDTTATISSELVAPSFTALGFPTGGTSSQATGVSGNGAVLFGTYRSSTGATRGFRWSAAENFVDLGLVGGTYSTVPKASSFDGSTIVGRSSPSGGFQWTKSAGILKFGDTLYDEVTGTSGDGSTLVGNRPFYWRAGSFTPLSSVSGGVSGVSKDGNTIVGTSSNFAFRWSQSLGLQSLGGMGSCVSSVDLPSTGSSASAVSENGSAVVGQTFYSVNIGKLNRSACPRAAYRWTAGGGFRRIPFLGSGLSAAAKDVSANGAVVVGASATSGFSGISAFRWTSAAGTKDLKAELLALGVTSVSNYILQDATGISDDGTVIVGTALNTVTKKLESYRAVLP